MKKIIGQMSSVLCSEWLKLIPYLSLVPGYNINNNISYSGSNYSFTSGYLFLHIQKGDRIFGNWRFTELWNPNRGFIIWIELKRYRSSRFKIWNISLSPMWRDIFISWLMINYQILLCFWSTFPFLKILLLSLFKFSPLYIFSRFLHI